MSLKTIPKTSELHPQAIMDLGTNTAHLVVGRLDGGGRLELLDEARRMIFLGRDGGLERGHLTDEAIEACLGAVAELTTVAGGHGVSPMQVRALATSAVRSAQNGPELIARIKEQTGLEVEVIDGAREAGLIYQGVLASGALEGLGRGVVMDFGGGSVEFIVFDRSWPGGVVWLQSYELGGQRLLERFFSAADPPGLSAQDRFEAFARPALRGLWQALADHPPEALVGSSGMFDTLLEMERHAHLPPGSSWSSTTSRSHASGQPGGLKGWQHATLMDREHALEAARSLTTLTYEERLALPGMPPSRARMMVGALSMLSLVLRHGQIPGLVWSDFALKEGALLEALARPSMRREAGTR